MKTIKINVTAKILEGCCGGQSGKVVAFESMSNEVYVRVDTHTTVITTSDNIEQ